jgi:RNA polymerase sigma factor (sigma-70 family)
VSTVDRAPHQSDHDLLAALTAGATQAHPAWSALVSRYAPRLYAVARSFGVGQATAEDLVQTAWLRLLERAGTLRDPGAVGPWLCTIVRNEARRYLSRHREIPTALQLDNQAGDSDPADARLVRDERVRAFRLAFAQLGSECQRLLRMLVTEPALSYDEIAAALGRPRGSLGPTRRRCLDRLRTLLPAGLEP